MKVQLCKIGCKTRTRRRTKRTDHYKNCVLQSAFEITENEAWKRDTEWWNKECKKVIE